MEPFYAYVRMINNDEVLSLIREENEHEITLEKPIFILRQRIDGGDPNDFILLFVTWIPVTFSDSNNVTIKKDKTLFVIPLNEEMKETAKRYAERGYAKPEKLMLTTTVSDQPPTTKTNAIKTIDDLEELLGLNTPKKKDE